MKKYNVPIVLGSDMFSEQWPIAIEKIMVPLEYGYTSLDVMKASTSTAGKILQGGGLRGGLGTRGRSCTNPGVATGCL